jgi:hypothetical protein
MPFTFSTDQIRKLKDWQKALSEPKHVTWYENTKQAIGTFNSILDDSRFSSGQDLTPSQLDELFRQMKALAANRALSNLLYKDNGFTSLILDCDLFCTEKNLCPKGSIFSST